MPRLSGLRLESGDDGLDGLDGVGQLLALGLQLRRGKKMVGDVD